MRRFSTLTPIPPSPTSKSRQDDRSFGARRARHVCGNTRQIRCARLYSHAGSPLGLRYIFLGLEAIDEDGLRKYRKRISLGRAFEALEFARSLGIRVAINLIADPDWDRQRFEVVRRWCLEIPEIVNISKTRDYRLYDIQHAVLPTRLPLGEFYGELVRTQRVLSMKHLGWLALRKTAATVSPTSSEARRTSCGTFGSSGACTIPRSSSPTALVPSRTR